MDSPLDRRARYDLAHFGDAIGEPSRAAILVALMGGTARPASELAQAAGITAQTATTHLQRLVHAGLLAVRAQGRHRYYALAGPEVAAAVEAFAALGRGARPAAIARDPLALARTCYAHLAGRVAIALWSRARDAGWVRWSDSGISLLPAGRDALAERGLVDLRLPLAGKACLDWSERVPHVAGPLGIAVCDALLARGWLARVPQSRALRVTSRGAERLTKLGVRWTE